MIRTPRGRMNQVITFYTVSRSSGMSASGGTKTRTRLLSCRAAVQPVRAKELVASGRAVMESTVKIKCDYDSRVNGKNEITWNNQDLEIVSVINIEGANIELEILAKEITE